MFKHCGWIVLASLIVLSSCNAPSPSGSTTPAPNAPAIVLLSVTSDANENPQSVDMAMKLAGF
ncbi:MAG: hypothetical protein ABI614_02305 [Planctomycetota bacterium]